jgi:Fur family zinc uptake transcriptional regulator
MSESSPAFHAHNHDSCTHDVLEHAENMVRREGLRLTPVRRRTLEILVSEHRAMGAYEVLDRLVADGFGNQPPVAYRALEFLVEHGLAHRINRLNAFAACMHPGEAHSPLFLICQSCEAVAEAPADAVRTAVEDAARGHDFAVERVNIEVLGTCPTCAGAE